MFINFIRQNWADIIIPIAVFVFCLMALLQLRKRALARIWRWAQGAKWPADIIFYQPIKRPVYILCVILSAYLGLATSPTPSTFKLVAEHSLWTLFVFTAVLAVLDVLNGLIEFLGKRLGLPGDVRIFRTVTKIVTISVSVLVVLGIWGVPTAPLLLLIAVACVLILLTLRDAAPNFFAGFQLMTRQHIKEGDLVKLENGEEGRITAMGWSNTQLQTSDGDNLIIPNCQLTRQRVARIGGRLKNTVPLEYSSILTERELEIARLISLGSTNKEIAGQLFIAENTVKVHVKNMLKKLELKNRQQLAVHAVLKEGLKTEVPSVK